MKLKEAFTLQNKLATVYQQVLSMLNADMFASSTITHMYSKANIGNDVVEKVLVPINRFAGDKRYEFDKLLGLALAIKDDKLNLTMAIDRAKAAHPVNFDELKQANIIKQNLIRSLSSMEGAKAYERFGENQVHGKDNEGKPAKFTYPTKTVVTYDIDRDLFKSTLKTLKKEFDETSLKLDELLLTINVDFTPEFDYDSNVEEIYLGL